MMDCNLSEPSSLSQGQQSGPLLVNHISGILKADQSLGHLSVACRHREEAHWSCSDAALEARMARPPAFIAQKAIQLLIVDVPAGTRLPTRSGNRRDLFGQPNKSMATTCTDLSNRCSLHMLSTSGQEAILALQDLLAG